MWQALRFFGGLRLLLSLKTGSPGLHFPPELIEETLYPDQPAEGASDDAGRGGRHSESCAEMRSGRGLGTCRWWC